MLFFSQDLSEHDIYLDDCEANVTLPDDNSNDENDVDDETMSGIKFMWFHHFYFSTAMLCFIPIDKLP